MDPEKNSRAELLRMPVKELAELFDLTPRRIQQLAQQGHIPQPSKGGYPLLESVRGYIAFLKEKNSDAEGVNIYPERFRLTKAKAEIEEMTLQKMKGELVPKSDVVEAWQTMIGLFRTKMLSVPTKAAPLARASKTNAEAQEIIKKQVYQALRELKETEVIIET